MPPSAAALKSQRAMETLSRLVLSPSPEDDSELNRLSAMADDEFQLLLSMAHSNHVVIRGFEVYRRLAVGGDRPHEVRKADEIIAEEQARIQVATKALTSVCNGLVQANIDVTVIKTLDHWPDFGSDMDLYTNANPERVCALMQDSFSAKIMQRSWGDRLAGKWNFEVPDAPEAVEIHMQRLGQTGEQLTLALNLPSRSRVLQFGDMSFRVASATDRILISTLQRMYRHFYFRLCDIIDSANLVRSGSLDFEDLRQYGQSCGIWPGAATYLVLVSDYVKRYSGFGLTLPAFVRDAAHFDGSVMYSGGSFLRVPIVPQSAGLYGTQLMGTLRRGELESSSRLGILPWLASAAAVGYKLTGSDKGIW